MNNDCSQLSSESMDVENDVTKDAIESSKFKDIDIQSTSSNNGKCLEYNENKNENAGEIYGDNDIDNTNNLETNYSNNNN